jgi:hypothetical protein
MGELFGFWSHGKPICPHCWEPLAPQAGPLLARVRCEACKGVFWVMRIEAEGVPCFHAWIDMPADPVTVDWPEAN